MNTTRRLWIGLGLLLALSFGVLLWMGREVYLQAPPLPERVVTTDGQPLYTRAELETGRSVWQSIGGQQLGTIWGHGALVAPDWSADWLHRESEALLELWAQREHAQAFTALDLTLQEALRARLRQELRHNTYDAASGTITVSTDRASAMRSVAGHYEALFGDDPALVALRTTYAMRDGTVDTPEHRHALTGFFFWTAWASTAERPGSRASYTSNWPYDPVVGNTPTPSNLIWSVFSVLFLIAGIGLLAWHYAVYHGKEAPLAAPVQDPLKGLMITPSMRATQKYFWVVMALFLAQILLGAVTAHFQVERQFYGIDVSRFLPYSLTRSWHTELAVLWIATAWLGTGLYIAPAVSGHEPRFQRLGVNFLFVCLLVIVVGAFAGQWFAVMQKLGLKYNFWFGHQGWEYVDLGRFWQIFLFVGLMLWLTLVGRALWPALRNKQDETSSIVGLLFLSTVAIGLLYGAGLMWGEHTHIAVVEYWRWWVVHLWVEGFFEVFAVAVISFLFVKLGLVRAHTATVNVLFATVVFMAGGVLGTFHHLYWTGTPTAVLALGASFSALEVVPLALIGLEAHETWAHSRSVDWMARYRWPIMFFLAVSFWNLVGAGLFGFLINTPTALYFMQGLNLTPLHGHTALFGVYGMLGIGLMLFCLRGLRPEVRWPAGLLRGAFWTLNIGLGLMALLTLLPLGVLQLNAALENGYWYARSELFMNQPIVHLLVWCRVPGDTLFAVGALLLATFVARLWIGARREA